MNIRKATKNDTDAILSIYNKTHDLIEKGELSIGWQREIYPTIKTIEEGLKRDDLFVVEDDEVVGTVIFNQIQVPEYYQAHWEYVAKDEEVMVMHTLVIDPDQKGKGYARNVLKFYEDYALEHNCHYLRIDTNAINKVARAMYKKHGYKEIDILPCVFNGIPNVNLVCIEKKL